VVDTAQKNLRRIRKYTLNIGLPQTAAIATWTAVGALLLHREASRAFLTIAALAVFTGLLALSIIDAYTHRVPRYVTGLMIVVGVPAIVLDAVWHWDPAELLRGFAGAIALFALYSLISVVVARWLRQGRRDARTFGRAAACLSRLGCPHSGDGVHVRSCRSRECRVDGDARSRPPRPHRIRALHRRGRFHFFPRLGPARERSRLGT